MQIELCKGCASIPDSRRVGVPADAGGQGILRRRLFSCSKRRRESLCSSLALADMSSTERSRAFLFHSNMSQIKSLGRSGDVLFREAPPPRSVPAVESIDLRSPGRSPPTLVAPVANIVGGRGVQRAACSARRAARGVQRAANPGRLIPFGGCDGSAPPIPPAEEISCPSQRATASPTASSAP